MKKQQKIDFVVTWVDGNDPEWQAEKARYSGLASSDSRELRYREWGILRYWFRAVEQYAPWVNNIYFVTCGHYPKWLNPEHPKLRLVKHSDYMPAEYLPTFSSHPIELNLHRIKGLSEHFVYFNDDMYLVNPAAPEDFFVNGKPCDCLVGSAITPRNGEFSSILCANVSVINDHFTKQQLRSLGMSKVFSPKYGKLLVRTMTTMPYHYILGFYNPHIAQPHLKSSFEEVWAAEPELLHATCLHRFRDLNDVSPYLMRYWVLCKGNFYPSAPCGKYYNLDADMGAIQRAILNPNPAQKTLTLNDSVRVGDQNERMRKLRAIFRKKFPKKSEFELFDEG